MHKSEPTHAFRRPVVVVTGPTAAGKTAAAISIARRFDGEIVNADSMQVFQYMDIGTAKPSIEERGSVPHHLFDIITPNIPYTAGRYARDARRAADDIHGRGKLVVLTGGTGLYIRSLLGGLIETGEVDPELRQELEEEHAKAVAEGDPLRLHRRLGEFDAEAARSIHPNDARRTIRALEIAASTGQPPSQMRRDHAFAERRFETLHLALDPGREAVNLRIDARCHEMIEAGLLQEVRKLRDRGYGPELRPMQAIGYRHVNPVVDGSDTLANALRAMQHDTRQFARRQRTWLRAIDDVMWLDPTRQDTVLEAVDAFLQDRPEPRS